VREVHQALDKNSGYTTTLKQMQVMTEKGLLVRNERYRSHVYEACVPKENTRQQIAGDLLRRAFEGSAKDLLVGALAAQPASDAELAEIRRLLKDIERKRGFR
jgi:predicted transcriptional regulator